MKKIPCLLLLLFFLVYPAISQGTDEFVPLDVRVLDNPAPGYLFLSPYSQSTISVADNSGLPYIFFSRGDTVTSRPIGLMVQNGYITYFDTRLNMFLIINSNMQVIDSAYAIGYETDFHDFKLLPNGNYLIFGLEYRTVDMSSLVDGGCSDATVQGYVIQEVNRSNQVVFEWHGLDHIPVTDATPDVLLTDPFISYMHCNSIDMDTDGNILVSSRHLDEITKINKITGEIIWRLGGKECKGNQFRFVNDTVDGFWGFTHQHQPTLLSNGNILLLDNGNLKDSTYSRVVEYHLNPAERTATKVWEYRPNPDVFDPWMGGVQRLPNGNTLICWGGVSDINGELGDTGFPSVMEVRPDKTTAMEIHADGSFYRAFRFVYKMAALTNIIDDNAYYNFNDTKNQTGVSLQVDSHSPNGKITVEKHYYKAHNLNITGTKPCLIYPFRIVLSKESITSLSGNIIFNLQKYPEITHFDDLTLYRRSTEGTGNFTLVQSSYSQSTNELMAQFAGFGEYIIASMTLKPPKQLFPKNEGMGLPVDSYLSFYKESCIENYLIQISMSPTFDTIQVEEHINRDTILPYHNFQYNTEYYWRIKSVDSDCESQWSEVWRFTTIISKPLLSLPLDSASEIPLTGKVCWLGVNGAENYQVQIAMDSGFKNVVIDEDKLTDREYPYKDLNYNKLYYWRVKAYASNYSSDWSQYRIFRTLLGPPSLEYPTKE
ncbi:MAG: hypothetical protein QG635_1736, partial [Bacteroidota bacterium]|nr:hypothetical protein [Bacteroidota bacterium]